MRGNKKALAVQIVTANPYISIDSLTAKLGAKRNTARHYRHEIRKQLGIKNEPCQPGWKCLSCRLPECTCEMPATKEEQQMLSIARGDRI